MTGAVGGLEEVGCAYLAAFEDEFQVVEGGVVGVGLAEGRSGLNVGQPGERVEAELLRGVGGGIASAKEDTVGLLGVEEDVA